MSGRGTWNWCVQALSRVLSQVTVLLDGRSWSGDILDSCILTLELVYREFMVKSVTGLLEDNKEAAAQLVFTVLRLFVSREVCNSGEYFDTR
jgi:hypothetical protein